jgi:ABC-type protease/lipase transport system fused ATPase/permease subunit
MGGDDPRFFAYHLPGQHRVRMAHRPGTRFFLGEALSALFNYTHYPPYLAVLPCYPVRPRLRCLACLSAGALVCLSSSSSTIANTSLVSSHLQVGPTMASYPCSRDARSSRVTRETGQAHHVLEAWTEQGLKHRCMGNALVTADLSPLDTSQASLGI